jgi:DNA mismatch repair protein MSH4
VQNEDRYSDIKDALKTVNKLDFDKLISSVRPDIHCLNLTHVQYPTFKLAASDTRISNTAKAASARVSQMLNLRSVVRNLPSLQKALTGCHSQLLRIIHNVRIVLR